MASEDESSSAFVSESEEEKAVLLAKGGAAAGEAIEEASEAEATETAEEDTEAEETAEEDNDEDDDDDEKDEEGGAAEAEEEVVMLLCVLSLDDGDVLRKRKIWRRITVPADFSLLELHVALQNAFDWEDTHLHDFTQPRRHAWRRLLDPAAALADEITDSEAETDGATAKPKPATAAAATAGIIAPATSEAVLPPLPDTQYRGFGRTDLSAVAELLQLDLDSLPPGFTRTFKTVAGAKEEAADDLILTPASLDLGGSAEVVFVEHADVAAAGEGKEVSVLTGPGEVLDERAFEVGAVFSKNDPLLVYQYDFGMSYEVHLIFEGKFPATEGVNYPTCLAGAGASPAEDGNDMDDEGALLPSYDYTDFAVLDVLANFEKSFEDAWPVGPGSEDSIDAPRCYMCRYNRECGRRRECTGKCCGYCLKAPLHLLAGSIPLRDADAAYEGAVQKLQQQQSKAAESAEA
ncbi:unnamed protein product [Closterium sp. Naga37s-1]|nr:unnamed protein product [Closterium sp. Naga37s-1]